MHLAGKNRKGSFLVIIIGGILDANKKWDRGREVTISKGSFSIIIIFVLIDATRNGIRGREVAKSIEGALGVMEKDSPSEIRFSILNLEDKANMKEDGIVRTQLSLGLDI